MSWINTSVGVPLFYFFFSTQRLSRKTHRQCISFNSSLASPKWNSIKFLISVNFLLPWRVFSFLQYVRILSSIIKMVISFMSSCLIIPYLQKWQTFLPAALHKHKTFFPKSIEETAVNQILFSSEIFLHFSAILYSLVNKKNNIVCKGYNFYNNLKKPTCSLKP